MMQLYATIALLLSLIMTLPVAASAEADTSSLLTTVRFERSLHFRTPVGEPVVAPSGKYAVAVEGAQALQLKTDTQESPG